MTNFQQMFKVNFLHQFKLVNQLIFFDFVGIIISFVMTLILSSYVRSRWTVVLAGLVALVGFITIIACVAMLAVTTKNQMHANRFRLVPITEARLYTTIILNSITVLFYLIIVQLVLGIIVCGLAWLYSDFRFSGISTFNFWIDLLQGLVAGIFNFLLSALAFILIVHLIDFVSTVILDYVPGGRQRIVKLVVYLVAIFAVVYLVSGLLRLFKIASFQLAGVSVDRVYLWLNVFFLLILTTLMGVANVFLTKFLETDR